MRSVIAISCIVGASSIGVAGPVGPTVVVPNINEVDPGPSNQAFPWSAGSPMRYQQLYAADQINIGATIDAFAYRIDESAGTPFGPVAIAAQIWFGYSDLNPTELTEVFDANFSSKKTLVFDGTVMLSSAGSGFDIVVDVDNTFTYDPAEGNLLMEIVIPGTAFTTQFDAAGTGLGEGGTPWTDRLWAFGAGSEIGNLAGDDGMVTQLIFAGGGGCFADCNGDGDLNILDFVCFQGKFTSGDPSADCNGDGDLNILDFVCYQGAFQEGCP